MAKRVVVTGVGLVSPVGDTPDQTFQALLEGKSGIRRVPELEELRFADQPLPVVIAGSLRDFDPAEYVDRKEAKRMDPFILFAQVAAVQAWREAGFPERVSDEEGEKGGTLIGVGMAGVGHVYEAWETLKTRGPRRISPLFIPSVIGNLAPGHIGMRFNVRGPNWTPASSGASGATAYGEAMIHIRDGRCEYMIAGGAESVVTPMVICGLHNMGALTDARQDEPENACRPFDQGRSGSAIGEGAGVMIFEELERAQARGAKIYCEVAGYGAGQDPGVPNQPTGIGMKDAIQNALEDAGLDRDAIGYVNAHGSAVVESDRTEARALREVFGDRKDLRVGSTKGATGDLIGAAGGIEGVITALAIARGQIPPTRNLDNLDPECGPFHYSNKAEDRGLDAAMSLNFGTGGTNAALIFKRFEA